ncbi:MAG: hypothetical protein AB7F09_02800 [Parvibaculaceae bacterium]
MRPGLFPAFCFGMRLLSLWAKYAIWEISGSKITRPQRKLAGVVFWNRWLSPVKKLGKECGKRENPPLFFPISGQPVDISQATSFFAKIP